MGYGDVWAYTKTVWSRGSLQEPIGAQLVKKLEGSLRVQTSPAIGPYPEPDAYSPRPRIIFLRYFNIILAAMCKIVPVRISNIIFAYVSHVAHACHVSRPFHPPWFDHLNNVWCILLIIRFLLVLFLHLSVLSLSRPSTLLNTFFYLEDEGRMFLWNVDTYLSIYMTADSTRV